MACPFTFFIKSWFHRAGEMQRAINIWHGITVLFVCFSKGHLLKTYLEKIVEIRARRHSVWPYWKEEQSHPVVLSPWVLGLHRERTEWGRWFAWSTLIGCGTVCLAMVSVLIQRSLYQRKWFPSHCWGAQLCSMVHRVIRPRFVISALIALLEQYQHMSPEGRLTGSITSPCSGQSHILPYEVYLPIRIIIILSLHINYFSFSSFVIGISLARIGSHFPTQTLFCMGATYLSTEKNINGAIQGRNPFLLMYSWCKHYICEFRHTVIKMP